MEYDNTTIERFVKLVKDTGGIRMDSATKFVGVDKDTLMKVAGILSEHDVIKITYNVVGETLFKPSSNIDKKFDEAKKERLIGANEPIKEEASFVQVMEDKKANPEDKTERVDTIVDELRQKIKDKKKKTENTPEK